MFTGRAPMRPALVLLARLALAIVLAAGAFPATASQEMEKLIEEQFIRYDPDYLQHRALFGARLRQMAAAIATAEAEARAERAS
jgi:hypothetical protein